MFIFVKDIKLIQYNMKILCIGILLYLSSFDAFNLSARHYFETDFEGVTDRFPIISTDGSFGTLDSAKSSPEKPKSPLLFSTSISKLSNSPRHIFMKKPINMQCTAANAEQQIPLIRSPLVNPPGKEFSDAFTRSFALNFSMALLHSEARNPIIIASDVANENPLFVSPRKLCDQQLNQHQNLKVTLQQYPDDYCDVSASANIYETKPVFCPMNSSTVSRTEALNNIKESRSISPKRKMNVNGELSSTDSSASLNFVSKPTDVESKRFSVVQNTIAFENVKPNRKNTKHSYKKQMRKMMDKRKYLIDVGWTDSAIDMVEILDRLEMPDSGSNTNIVPDICEKKVCDATKHDEMNCTSKS